MVRVKENCQPGDLTIGSSPKQAGVNVETIRYTSGAVVGRAEKSRLAIPSLSFSNGANENALLSAHRGSGSLWKKCPAVSD